jgi:hypothetical protein
LIRENGNAKIELMSRMPVCYVVDRAAQGADMKRWAEQSVTRSIRILLKDWKYLPKSNASEIPKGTTD